MKPVHRFDLLIAGGGPAGMTAAIYAARAGLHTAVIERQICGGLVNSTYVVENFPSYTAINGMELMEKTHAQICRLGVHVDQAAEIESIRLDAPIKSLETADDTYQAPAVILATGREPIRLPEIEDCEQIHYCSICDGPSYRDKRIIVVGGGNAGFDEALYLLSLGVEHITLIELMDHCAAEAILQQKAVDSGRIDIRLQTRLKAVELKDRRLANAALEQVQTQQMAVLAVDGIFVFIGQRPNTGFLQGVIALTPQGYIRTDTDMNTNLDGVFAAGDVIEKRFRQITTAIGDGTVAALNAVRYLRETGGIG
jgi:thioredoxin reductase (NADPH)